MKMWYQRKENQENSKENSKSRSLNPFVNEGQILS